MSSSIPFLWTFPQNARCLLIFLVALLFAVAIFCASSLVSNLRRFLLRAASCRCFRFIISSPPSPLIFSEVALHIWHNTWEDEPQVFIQLHIGQFGRRKDLIFFDNEFAEILMFKGKGKVVASHALRDLLERFFFLPQNFQKRWFLSIAEITFTKGFSIFW